MEIVVVLVFLASLSTVVLRAVHADGRGHIPPVCSHMGWSDPALPNRSYSSITPEGV